MLAENEKYRSVRCVGSQVHSLRCWSQLLGKGGVFRWLGRVIVLRAVKNGRVRLCPGYRESLVCRLADV